MEHFSHAPDVSQIQNPIAQETELIELLRSCSKIVGIIVASIGFVVILGWIFHLDLLKSVLPGLVTMKANTAICFILGGVSLWLWHENNFQEMNATAPKKRPLRQGLALLIIAIALLTLIQYGFKLDFGIDQLLFKESGNAVNTIAPGRMGANTALNFLFLGSALLLLSLRHPSYFPAQLFSLFAFLIAFLGFLGYIYGNSYFYNPALSTAMALHTSVAFMLLCLGILFANPKQGAMASVTAQNAGGIMARRLSLLVILVPSLTGWLILLGYKSKVYTPEMAISLLSILNVVIFTLLIWWNANSLGIIDGERVRSQVALQQALETSRYNSKEKERIATELTTAVHEITIAMDELSASSRITAEQAQGAATSAREALAVSSEGTQAVEQTQEGMRTLEQKVAAIANSIVLLQEQTSQIGSISSLVSELASQTNMLALNAAVEAVRAGEHGKGFGVVAAEIRKLADESKQSAQKINALVAYIQKASNLTVKVTDEGTQTVQLTVKIADRTAAAFRSVAVGISQICTNNQQIALTAQQQALAIEQVVNAMNGINAATR